ncbi:MAG: LysM peptidoglycan-binding domain-containing protein [Verrucomicrobiota bacterium]
MALTISEPLGWTTYFAYDSRANVIVRTNALDEVTRWDFHPFFNKAIQQITPQPADSNGWATWTNFYAYDAAGNLTNHSDAVGPLVRYTYSTNGLVITSTDANGNTSSFAYDTNGFLIARTDPATNTWQLVVNDVGWKLAEINPFNDTTYFAYDLNGNPVQTTDPLNRTFTRQYDANGNLLAQSDGKNVFTRHAYDFANQRVATTNRVGSVWFFTFTSRGKPDRTTAPLIGTTTNFYDSANRLVAVSDPLGNSITNQYDPNGNSVALFDTLGQRWSKTFDRLNRVIAEADPLGDAKSTTFDIAGRIKTVTTPNGFPSQHEYDGRGRLTKWKDAEGFDWLYAYDGNANITNITDALNGHYVMAYGPLNERRLERNQDNFEWQYTYDRLLRLKTQRDPNGTLRTRKYDKASRVTSLTLSTGREDTYTLDKNDNPEVIDRSLNDVAVATTKLTYDELDRVTRVVDPHSQSVDYGFDALSRVISVTYPGNHTLTNRYDALSRLTNQVDWAARQMSYDYDKAGRLIRRAYPNGVVQTNTFDTAGRLTSLQYSVAGNQSVSNGISIALAYAYDRNGNKVGSSEKGTLQWPLPTLTDEKADYTKSGRLKTRMVEHLPSPGGEGQGEGGTLPATINYSFDPSGNMTNATGNGQSWSLTYDEDNRTTSIRYSTATGTTNIVNRYDALGRRIAKTVDGVTTGYVLSLVGGMERILCDLDATGNVTAWYVHGPDLCYRVDAANNVVCYHADAQANIIAVTDGGGTNVAQYAYTPYGRSLGSTNLQSQISNPYLFVGSQGVMEELPGLYFMRARYYSADAGVFLSTDAVKNIGPGWKPVTYQYANANPLQWSDPNGTFAITLGVTLVHIIFESVEIDYDILVRGESVSWGQLGGRFANAAFTGATEGAIAEFGGVFFAGPLGRAGSFATKGLANFAGNALENYISGEGNLNDAAAEAFVDNALTAGMDYLGGNVVGRKPKSLSSMLFGKHAQAGFGNDLLKGTLIGSAKQVGESLGSSKQSVSAQTASVAAPKGSGTTAATSTKPSGASGGGTTSSGAPATTYTVKAGDTLGNIGYKYGTTATAIANANGIKNPNLIRPGQVLKIR